MASPSEKLIRRDLARTYPEHVLFRQPDGSGQEGLFNVMKAYSLVDREVGYCQGSAFIVGLLLMQMPEEEAFCVFIRLMHDSRLRELFKPSMAELGLCMYQIESLMQVAADKVTDKLSATLSWVRQTVTQTVTATGATPSVPSAPHAGPDRTGASVTAQQRRGGGALSAEDEELLSKLEEQNKLLQAVSSGPTGPGEAARPSEEELWAVWGGLVSEWQESRCHKDQRVKDLVREGIPHHFRGIVWQLLCDAQNVAEKDQYSELLKMASPSEKLIRRDLARTYPEHVLFRQPDGSGQEGLFNVMKAYSLVDREVGYCQGSAFIVGLLLMQMPEEEAFCVFIRLMHDSRLRELFKPSMAELGLCMYQIESLMQDRLCRSCTHT
ncbi:ecotropic viral integration site 5 protein homolog [Petromyzon marinus]|uniref:ecotropic viral integration site 5 protein homolog n=1 Tax=Petromyzon marinus TaxID=7757 RepID=UPI003F6E5157